MQENVTLREILLQSMDPNSPNFLHSQQLIQEFMKNDAQQLTRNLIKEIHDPNTPYSIVFLSLVLMDHCVNQSLIPITRTNRYVQSNFPPDLILQLFDVTFNYFLNKEYAVRNTSIHLFSILAMTQLGKLSEIGIDRRLIEMLNGAQSYEAFWSATQCIWSLMLHYKFSEEQNQIIIQNLFRILSLQNGNFQLIKSCVKMLGNFIYLIERLFNDDQKFLDFVLQIMSFLVHPELEEVVYQFMDETLCQFPELFPNVCEKLLKNSVEALCKPASRSALISLICMWESIVGRRPPIVNQIVQPLVLPLIMTMQSHSIQAVLDYQEWEPYTAAYSCLHCFAYNAPDVTIPTLLQYSQNASGSPNPLDREGSLKCLHITIRISLNDVLAPIIPSALELLSHQISDQAPRVRNEAVATLIELIKKLNTYQPFANFIPLLFNLSKDVDPTARSALKALQIIAKLPDFDHFQEFFMTLISLIPTLPPTLIQSAIECFTLTPDSKISNDTVFMSFQYLYNLIVQTVNENRNSTILDTLCIVISSTVMRCDERIAPFALELCKMMHFSIAELSTCNALTVIANITYPLPAFVQEQLPVFVPLIINAMKTYNDPLILIPAVRVIPLLVDKLELGPFFEMLMESMYDSLQYGETAHTKTEILNSFYRILSTQPIKFSPYIPKLHSSILFIITNLEVAYQLYLDLTAQIVTIICKIELKLFRLLAREDQQHIFNLCVLMLNTIAKMPPLLRLNNGDLFDIILCMYQLFGEETYRQINQVPAIKQILRSGLQQLDKSENEIESYISKLTDNTS